jgi:CubicO group peptidase (beta-lactamase class C family)
MAPAIPARGDPVSKQVPIHGECDPRFAKVRDAFEQNFASSPELGAAVAVSVDGEPVVDLWGGWTDQERTREWERDTIVNVYSTTKGMAAICAHRLAQEGRLDLDAPVAAYWPEFAAAGKETLPVRYLLSHQAGLPGVEKPLPEDAYCDWELMTDALAEQKPWWEPGTRHGYHALTFGFLVGEVVRRVSGRSLGSYFREEIAEPLDADFWIGFGRELDPRVSDIYPAPEAPAGQVPEGPMADFMRDMEDPTTITGAAFNNPRMGRNLPNTREWRAAEIPAANGHGTARALARIYGALSVGGELDGVHVLAREQIETALQEQAFGPDAVLGQMPMRFGLGFMLRQDFMPMGPNPRAFGHPGAGGSIGFADPDARVGFGYTMNQMQQGITGSLNAFRLIGETFASL